MLSRAFSRLSGRLAARASVHGTRMMSSTQYVAGFDPKERKQVEKWKVTPSKWEHDPAPAVDEIAAHLQAHQTFLKKHGESSSSVAAKELYNALVSKYGAPGEADSATKSVEAFSAKITAAEKAGQDLDAPLTPDQEAGLQQDVKALFRSVKSAMLAFDQLKADVDGLPEGYEPAQALPADVQASFDKFLREVEGDVLVGPDDEILTSNSSKEAFDAADRSVFQLDPFLQPIAENEYAEHMQDYDAPIDVENDMREFNQHWASFSDAKLPPSIVSKLDPKASPDLKQLAQLLSENPSLSGDDIEEMIAYYKSLESGKLTPNRPFDEQFPELKHKITQPWTLQLPIQHAGAALADRLTDEGLYADIPSETVQRAYSKGDLIAQAAAGDEAALLADEPASSEKKA